MRRMLTKNDVKAMASGGALTPENLATVLEGSDNIVIDENVEGDKLQARLDLTGAEDGYVLTFNGSTGTTNWAAASGKKLYEHNITLNSNDYSQIVLFNFINDSATRLVSTDFGTLCTVLRNQGFNGTNKRKIATGRILSGTDVCSLFGLYAYSTSRIIADGIKMSDGSDVQINIYSNTFANFFDNVVEL